LLGLHGLVERKTVEPRWNNGGDGSVALDGEPHRAALVDDLNMNVQVIDAQDAGTRHGRAVTWSSSQTSPATGAVAICLVRLSWSTGSRQKSTLWVSSAASISSQRATSPSRRPAALSTTPLARNKVERAIGRLKQFRRVATRYEKRAVNYQAMVALAAVLVWL